jgi:hypothetical protein
MALDKAEAERLKKLGITAKDRDRLERCLCTLADFEGLIKDTLRNEVRDGASAYDHAHVCAALRRIVDGE